MSSASASLWVRIHGAAQAAREISGVGAATRGLGTAARVGATSLGLLGAAAVKMGLQHNASLENAQLRFELFTSSAAQARKVLEGVQAVDLKSGFDLSVLADAAAYLGNAEIAASKVPRYLQGIANAAAAAGGGNDRLERIATAIGQIQSKGKISAEELQQLAEAGVNVRSVLKKELGLSGEQVADIGNQAVDSQAALDAIIRSWTSGKMGKAAEKQTKTLSGQFDMLTGNLQKAAGAATEGLAKALEDDVLPAANSAADQITEIFGREGVPIEVKLKLAKDVLQRELGPIVSELGDQIDQANIPQRLADAIEAAVPTMLRAAGDAAPKVAEAFVNAWLGAPTWAKVLTAGVIAKKLAGSVAGLPGVGGGSGGAFGGLFFNGQSPPKALWVRLAGGAAGVPPAATAGIAGVASTLGAASFAGAAGIAAFLLLRGKASEQQNPGSTTTTGTGPIVAGDPVKQAQANAALSVELLRFLGIDTRPGQPSTSDPFRRPPLLGGLPRFENHITVELDGQVLSKKVDEVIAREKARR